MVLPFRRWIDRCSSPAIAVVAVVVVVVGGGCGGNDGAVTAEAVCAATMSTADVAVDAGAAPVGCTTAAGCSELDAEEDSLGWEGENMEPRMLLLPFLWWPGMLLPLRWPFGMLLVLVSVENMDVRESCLCAFAGTGEGAYSSIACGKGREGRRRGGGAVFRGARKSSTNNLRAEGKPSLIVSFSLRLSPGS